MSVCNTSLAQLSNSKAAAIQSIEMKYQSGLLKLLQQKMMMHQKLQSEMTNCINQSQARFQEARRNYAAKTVKLEDNWKVATNKLVEEQQRMFGVIEANFSKLLLKKMVFNVRDFGGKRSTKNNHSANVSTNDGHQKQRGALSAATTTSLPFVVSSPFIPSIRSIPAAAAISNLDVRSSAFDADSVQIPPALPLLPQHRPNPPPNLKSKSETSSNPKHHLTEECKVDPATNAMPTLEFHCAECNEYTTNDQKRYLLHVSHHRAPSEASQCSKSSNLVSAPKPMHKPNDESIDTVSTQSACNDSVDSFCSETSLFSNDTVDGAKPFRCLICSASFLAVEQFTEHLQSKEHAEHKVSWRRDRGAESRPGAVPRPFGCALCQRSFQRLSALSIHHRVHSAERPYRCQFCSKSFRQRCHLIRHKRLHGGERPFQCHSCDKRFSSSTRKKRHFEREHGVRDTEQPLQCTERVDESKESAM